MTYFDIKSVSLILSGIINLVLGIFMYSKEKENETNLLFVLIAFSVSLWALSRALFEIFPLNEQIYVWGDLLYLSAGIIPLCFVLFTIGFPNKKIPLSNKSIFFITLPFLLVVAMVFIPNLIVDKITQDASGNKIIFFGGGYFLYSLYIIAYFLWGFLNLIKKYFKYDGIVRTQIKYILSGTFIATLIGITTNLILPMFGNFKFFWLGPVTTIIMVVFIAYAIVKHHLLRVKIIATEILASMIVIIVLTEVFLAKSVEEIFVRTIVFLFVLVFVYLLIKSVLKEVEIRNEMERVAENLTIVNERLRALDKAKSDFISITSHQLRSPLTSIKGYASMILEGSFGIIPKKAQGAVDRIMKSSERLIATIEDFLDIGRIESGKMKYSLSRFDLEKMLRDIIGDFVDNVQKARELNLEFVAHGDNFIITADQNKIRQVLTNLIDNSVKYTPQGSVKAFLSKSKEDGCVLIEIKDTGVGIAPEVIGKLFHKFSRVDGIELLHTEGLGLGLYVAEKIIKSHKGKIWVESEGDGKGSSFFIKLPINLS